MRLIVEVALSAIGVLLVIPTLVVLAETLAALFLKPRVGEAAVDSSCRLVVLVPAHDEAGQIEATVRALASDLPKGGRLLVVADNCTDDTAVRAGRAGAEVIERQDRSRRGKGFAISFALDHLAVSPPDVVVLVDADCRVGPGGLCALANAALRSGRPVQADYLLESPPSPGPLASVSALAILLRNRVRPRGMQRLGWPCHLTGSGMAFPWRLLRDAPGMGANLVEDLALGIELALRGAPPLFCPAVEVKSELPAGRAAGLGQRRRWEEGQLRVQSSYVARLAIKGVVDADWALLALALDLSVPPLALLVSLQLAGLGAAIGAGLLGFPVRVLTIASAVGLVSVAVSVGVTWAAFGRGAFPLRVLLLAPVYVLWKIPLYLGLALGRKQKTWQRTPRSSSATSAERSSMPPPP